jgi:flagellar biosynthesis/type III secretory pathway ATPase
MDHRRTSAIFGMAGRTSFDAGQTLVISITAATAIPSPARPKPSQIDRPSSVSRSRGDAMDRDRQSLVRDVPHQQDAEGGLRLLLAVGVYKRARDDREIDAFPKRSPSIRANFIWHNAICGARRRHTQ